MHISELPEAIQGLSEAILEHLNGDGGMLVLNEMHPHFLTRIFEDGKAADGSNIGQYSTTPIYVPKQKFVRQSAFKAQGKNAYMKGTGNGKKQMPGAGQDHRSMYLEGGYKQLRDIQGRPTDKKNYDYTGSLRFSIKVVRGDHGYVLAITDQQESIKRRALEKRDGKIVFAPAEKEMEIIEHEATHQTGVAIDQYLSRLK